MGDIGDMTSPSLATTYQYYEEDKLQDFIDAATTLRRKPSKFEGSLKLRGLQPRVSIADLRKRSGMFGEAKEDTKQQMNLQYDKDGRSMHAE
ncbi:hypothetical protein CLAFUW4_03521 [Fulvia fulva]|uniref:Uncharacterized protein n=1 Tax=Passalora fulva TaxID=5499 RepID=A0A9Q8P565_PASFU|nr:uncharacterized protein CLAFUR5_03500 [Fulvia fulva]KAK4631991.1 hypothetical protein CLAFUR4_03510 [Fulvia fulva]KAK4632958.1 hypothetical protein CLAFUR0_03515 [Fulvia fulva]UJO13442.1 hypothetical protein CLAFUR5_03500 [Fulvia fulva]WPV11725.1 hypothetical protein CLAFUW4_03521 [Fulvia fulva]WPV26052.1 hypothetical protein CLAFUW7_03513 [Fulvia fulva]